MSDVSFVLLPLAAFFVSLVCSTVGISGAFLLLPVQTAVLGSTAPSVSATNQLFNLLATPSGILRYLKEGRMLWPLALVLSLGSVPGLFLGVWLRIRFLANAASFTLFAAAVLLFVGLSLKTRDGKSVPCGKARIHVRSFDRTRLVFELAGEQHAASVPGLGLLSFLAGIVGGAYGIGGGALVSPFLLAFFHLPVYALGAACLFSTFVTAGCAILASLFWAAHVPDLSIAPNLTAGLLLGLGGMGGMYLGARLQRHVQPTLLTVLLRLLVLAAVLSLASRALV